MLFSTRSAAVLAILIAGACTTAMNWRFSYQLGTNQWDSIIWAIFSVALDVTKWLILPFAALTWRSHKLRAAAAAAIWFVATLYSFTAAIGLRSIGRRRSPSAKPMPTCSARFTSCVKVRVGNHRQPAPMPRLRCRRSSAPATRQQLPS